MNDRKGEGRAMSNLKHWIWLTQRRGIAGQTAVQILEHFGSPEQVHAADRGAYETMGGLSEAAIRSLLDKSLDGADRILGDCDRLGVQLLTLQDSAYPERLTASCIPLYAAALRDDTQDIRDVPLDRAAVIIGSEGRGVSEEALSLCRKTIKIPMRGRCESLNAAAAASVVLWEMARGDQPDKGDAPCRT